MELDATSAAAVACAQKTASAAAIAAAAAVGAPTAAEIVQHFSQRPLTQYAPASTDDLLWLSTSLMEHVICAAEAAAAHTGPPRTSPRLQELCKSITAACWHATAAGGAAALTPLRFMSVWVINVGLPQILDQQLKSRQHHSEWGQEAYLGMLLYTLLAMRAAQAAAGFGSSITEHLGPMLELHARGHVVTLAEAQQQLSVVWAVHLQQQQ